MNSRSVANAIAEAHKVDLTAFLAGPARAVRLVTPDPARFVTLVRAEDARSSGGDAKTLGVSEERILVSTPATCLARGQIDLVEGAPVDVLMSWSTTSATHLAEPGDHAADRDEMARDAYTLLAWGFLPESLLSGVTDADRPAASFFRTVGQGGNSRLALTVVCEPERSRWWAIPPELRPKDAAPQYPSEVVESMLRGGKGQLEEHRRRVANFWYHLSLLLLLLERDVPIRAVAHRPPDRRKRGWIRHSLEYDDVRRFRELAATPR